MCWNCGKSCHYEKDCRQKWTQDKGWSRDKGNSKNKESNGKSNGKSQGKSKGKGKLNSVENWLEGWSETGAQGDEHAEGWTWSGEQAEGWWKATDDQNGSSSGQVMSANDQTAWERERAVGGIEMKSIETPYIEQDRWGQEWLMLNYDSVAAVTALPIAVAGGLPLEKRGEFRVASGAVIPNLGKIKMKSTDESGIDRTLRGNITEVAKPLLSAAEVSKRWDSLLFEDGGTLLERNTPVALEIRAVLAKHKVWSRRGKSMPLNREGNLYNAYVRAGHVTPELAPVEPSSSWTRMGVDDGQRDEQDESADQLEELRRVLAARQPTELERQKHSSLKSGVFLFISFFCVCVLLFLCFFVFFCVFHFFDFLDFLSFAYFYIFSFFLSFFCIFSFFSFFVFF